MSNDLASKSLHELLQLANDLTLDLDTSPSAADYWYSASDENDLQPTLFKPGATATGITGLETRLETTLPDDLRTFLQLTNGFGRNADDGMINGLFPGPAPHSTTDIKWCTAYDTASTLLTELLDLGDSNGGVALEDLSSLTRQQSYIRELGVRDTEEIRVLQPSQVERFRQYYHKMYDAADDERKAKFVTAMEKLAGSREGFEEMGWCYIRYSDGDTHAFSSMEDVVDQCMGCNADNGEAGSVVSMCRIADCVDEKNCRHIHCSP